MSGTHPQSERYQSQPAAQAACGVRAPAGQRDRESHFDLLRGCEAMGNGGCASHFDRPMNSHALPCCRRSSSASSRRARYVRQRKLLRRSSRGRTQTNRPDESWMLPVGRSLLDAEDGVFAGKKYLIVDRDTKYAKRFRDFPAEGGTKVIRLPPLSPNLNAFAERFVRSIKEHFLTKMIFVGQGSLRRALTDYMTHSHEERNHRGLGNRLILGFPANDAKDASIHRRSRLGGMLSYLRRSFDFLDTTALLMHLCQSD